MSNPESRQNMPLENKLSTSINRRNFGKGIAALAVSTVFQRSSLNESSAFSMSGTKSEAPELKSSDIGKYENNFDTSLKKQIKSLKSNFHEVKQISPNVLRQVMQTVGTTVSLPDYGRIPAPVLTLSGIEPPRYKLTKQNDDKVIFPNMGLDRYPRTDDGGVYAQLQGLYLGRVSKPIEVGIGKFYAEIGFSYRWLGGDNNEFIQIIEPSWLAWRSSDESISNYSNLIDTRGNFNYPQNVSTAPDSNGISIARALDNGIGKSASQFAIGDNNPAQDLSAEAEIHGAPGEFYSYEAINSAISAAEKHSRIYKILTLNQAYKDGYEMRTVGEDKFIDMNGQVSTKMSIDQAFPEISQVDIAETLSQLPNYKEYLNSDPITLEQLMPLIRVKSTAISPFIK